MRLFCRSIGSALMVLSSIGSSIGNETALHEFETVLLTEEFHSEGACIADINGDGVNDIVSGSFWYKGPDFRERTAFTTTKAYSIKGYSDFFFEFSDDFNRDGRADILTVGTPGEPAYWFENPGNDAQGHWKKHLAVQGVGNESPLFADLTGDGIKELICIQDGAFGYATADSNHYDVEWSFVPISGDLGYGRFTHGLGIGDINSDGRLDLLETNGWWEQTPEAGKLFRFHRHRFAQSGGAQMFAFDVDGDGDNDVVSTQNAHGYGISWFEQISGDGVPSFVEHPILTDRWQDNPFGISISQMHAVAAADIDGDGVKDIVTGKRYWAHGGNDPGAREANVLYWFRTVRPKTPNGTVQFEPYLIDHRSGVGTQLTVADVSKNGLMDVVVANKLGSFLFRHSTENPPGDELTIRRPKPSRSAIHVIGTSLFNQNVRTTEPLTSEEQLKTFVLPHGFTIDLVTSNPTIGQPMNLAFDGRGRLWVSSSLEYPFGAKPGESARDTIKIFEDTNGDGSFDNVTTFADGLDIPIGVLPYKNGVICFSIPNIWFFEDTDGDDRADKRTIFYGPFDTSRDRHGMCNAFTRGLDGWVYACHGFSNHSTVAGADGHAITLHSGNTFRFRLDGSRIEHYAHGQVNPFGIAVDRYGDIFTADCHTKPINLLLRHGYHESFGAPHDGLGFTPNVMEHLHGSTGIGGIALGEHTTFPDVYQNSTFGCNVVTSRVNRNTLIRNGSSVRAREESDFLTSSDPWFRPVYNIVGPDGSLYVADFYNAVIGHYEVDLHHPRRDRELGRVWRVSFGPTNARRDPHTKEFSARFNLTTASIDQLIELLASNNEIQARMAVHQIVDRFPTASQSLRQALTGASDVKRLRLLWCLHQLGNLNTKDIANAASAESELLRLHAMKMVEEHDSNVDQDVDLLLQGFQDPSPLVRRAAATASIAKQNRKLVRPLLNMQTEAALSDVHLRHAIKLALGHHLKNEAWFEELVGDAAIYQHQKTIAELCGFLKHKTAGRFLVHFLSQSPKIEIEQLKSYLKIAAGHVDEASASTIAAMISDRFAGESKTQLALLNEMRNGLGSKSLPMPGGIRQLATTIAIELFTVKPKEAVSPMAWSALPHPHTNEKPQPWGISTRRAAADGKKDVPLWSSFTNGETWTGIYRSSTFQIPKSFSFHLAGHDGEPSQPIQRNNFVRLRDAKTNQILKQASPKRNDTAQLVRWDTADIAGKEAFVELVDGDTGDAYAWIAVGRFSVKELNPSSVAMRRRQGAKIIEDFRLGNLRSTLEMSLPDHVADGQTAKAIARSLASLSEEQPFVRTALAEAMDFAGTTVKLRTQIAETISNRSPAVELLSQLMLIGSAVEQSRVADILCNNEPGADLLLRFVEAGTASAQLLVDLKRNEILQRVLNDAGKKRVDSLTEGVVADDGEIAKQIQAARDRYISAIGSAPRGQIIFRKQCMTCHQVGTEGKALAPNLDGIGNRGLDRLLEDILDPNRNVDVAFRAQTIVTDRGQVFSGLVKQASEGQIRLIESNGTERLINKKEIEEQTLSILSPMPANLGETLSDQETNDLLTYLLSLTN